MKKRPGDIIIFHMRTKNYDKMMYGSWDMVRDGRTDRVGYFRFIIKLKTMTLIRLLAWTAGFSPNPQKINTIQYHWLNSPWKIMTWILKSDSHLPNKLFYLLPRNPFKNDETCFLFQLKSSSFILKILKFLSWFFGQAEKTAWFEI